jgi:hypothetical protein
MIAPFGRDCKLSRLSQQLLAQPGITGFLLRGIFLRNGLAIPVVSARNGGQQAVIGAGGVPDLC